MRPSGAKVQQCCSPISAKLPSSSTTAFQSNSNPGCMAADMCHVDVTGVHLISIPAPPRGATIQARSPFRADHYFTSRPSARGDCSTRFTFLQNTPHFNSRPSARGDLETETDFYRQKFQFTPLREGRPIPKSVITDWFKFQFVPLREGRLSRNRSRLF